MNIILCVDKKGGMMFNNRRQSQDKTLVSKIIEIASSTRLLTSEYSASLFCEYDNVISNNDFINQAQLNDFCFIEDSEIPSINNIEDIYIFNWNRDYPADKYFTFDLKLNGYKKIKKEDFIGNSHNKITLEIYRRT